MIFRLTCTIGTGTGLLRWRLTQVAEPAGYLWSRLETNKATVRETHDRRNKHVAERTQQGTLPHPGQALRLLTTTAAVDCSQKKISEAGKCKCGMEDLCCVLCCSSLHTYTQQLLSSLFSLLSSPSLPSLISLYSPSSLLSLLSSSLLDRSEQAQANRPNASSRVRKLVNMHATTENRVSRTLSQSMLDHTWFPCKQRSRIERRMPTEPTISNTSTPTSWLNVQGRGGDTLCVRGLGFELSHP